MSDMSDPSNSSAGPIRVVVLRGITVDINPAGGLIVSMNSGYRFVYATNAFSPASGTPPSGDGNVASGPGNTAADGEGTGIGTGSNVVYLHSANTLAGRDSSDNAGGGSGDDTVSATGKVLPFSGPAVMNFLSGGSGSRGVSGGLGSVTVFGGNAGSNQLVAGQLPGELAGAGTVDQLFAADATVDTLAVAGGNETLSPLRHHRQHRVFRRYRQQFRLHGSRRGTLCRRRRQRRGDCRIGQRHDRRPEGPRGHCPAPGRRPRSEAARVPGRKRCRRNTVLRLPDGTVVTMIGISHPAGSSTA